MTEFGVVIFPTEYSIQPLELARAVEERGLDSIFVPEHTHIPHPGARPTPRVVSCLKSTPTLMIPLSFSQPAQL